MYVTLIAASVFVTCLFWQDHGLSHGLNHCKDLPDILMTSRVVGKHSMPCQIPAKDITSIPSSHFSSTRIKNTLIPQSKSITSKVHKDSQRDSVLLKMLVGDRERTSSKCWWQLAQVHQEEPQAGQMHGSGVCWNYSGDYTRQNKT